MLIKICRNFDLTALPDPMIPAIKVGIEHYIKGETYGEFGYEEPC